MKLNLKKELAALERMTVGELQQRYIDVFGDAVRSRHKHYLIRRITVFTVVDALTRVAARLKCAGDRVETDEKAGQLLALVA